MNQFVSYLFAGVLLCMICYEIYKGETIASSPQERCQLKNEPKQFWLSITFQTFLALGFFAIGLIIR